MSQDIYLHFEMAVIDNQVDALRGVIKDAVASAETEPGTLSYRYFLSEDGQSLHIYERYRDEAAMLAHMKGGGKVMKALSPLVRTERTVVAGPVSDTIKAALKGLAPLYLDDIGGFSR